MSGRDDRQRDRHSERNRDKDSDRRHKRDRDREREKDKEREKHRDRDRDRGSDSHRKNSSRSHKDKYEPERKEETKRQRSPAPAKTEVDEAEKKRQRLAKLAAWKSQKTESAAVSKDSQLATDGRREESGAQRMEEANGHNLPETENRAQAGNEEQEAWLPWEDPTAVFTASRPTNEMKEPPAGIPAPKPLIYEPHEGEDPLDAFMAAEVAPEVKAKEQEEAQKIEAARLERAKLMAEGKVPKLDKILEEESDEEETPDQEIQIPEHKVKLVIGPNGDKIKWITRKSKCRLQIKKAEEELNKGFLEKKSYAIPKPRKPGDEVKMVTMMLFGNAKECEIATRMIDEAIENREQKQKQREKEYERKRDQKNRDRQMYHLRHTYDYETLGIPIGASKAEARQAYRQLAKKYHPDKHPDNKEEMKEKFQAIQKAFDSLMSTDEDARIEALSHR